MNRVLRFSVRMLALAALVGALLDLPLPRRGADRKRIHLIDVSPSTRSGPLTAREAFQVARHDLERSPGEIVLFSSEAAVWGGTDFPSAPPLPGSDIGGALAYALWRDPGEIVLYTDGNATRGDLDAALLQARARDIPVHTVAIGPDEIQDIRIESVAAPSEAAEGERYEVRLTLVSTFTTDAIIVENGNENVVHLSAEVPATTRLERKGPGEMTFRISPEDDVPENNVAPVSVARRSERPRLLILSEGRSPSSEVLSRHYEVTVSNAFQEPYAFSGVILENFPARLLHEGQRETLRSYVQEFGGGLVMIGGPGSFGPGGYAGTPVEDVLPLWAWPDEKTAVVIALDRSGSTNQEIPGSSRRRFDVAVDGLEYSIQQLGKNDLLAVLPFSGEAQSIYSGAARAVDLAPLRAVRPSGPTRLSPVLIAAPAAFDRLEAPRRILVVITDGEFDPVEEPQDHLQRQVRALQESGVRMMLLCTGSEETSRKLAEAGVGEVFPVTELSRLGEILTAAVASARDPVVEAPAPLRLRGEDRLWSEMAPFPRPERIHRTSAKSGAEVLLVSGDFPVVARGGSGQGRSAACAFSFVPGWTGGLSSWAGTGKLLTRLVDETVSPVPGVRVSISREKGDLLLRCRHNGKPPDEFHWISSPSLRSGRLTAVPVGSREVGATLPFDDGGTVHVRAGGGHASIVVPASSEFFHWGRRPAVLRKISEGTGGRVLSSGELLATLSARSPVRWQAARTTFVILAIVLFLLDAALTALLPASFRRR